MNKLANMRNNVKKNLRQDIEDSQNKGGKRRDDPNELNYYNLKSGEKMTVLFVAAEDTGDLWRRVKYHGKGIRGVDRIICPREARGEKCAICEYFFSLCDDFKSGGSTDKVLQRRYRDFMPNDKTVMQAVVLEAPMEIPQAPDGNQVKVFNAPTGIINTITNYIMEGQLDEEDIVVTPFVIKKTTNSGGFSSYDDSFFARKPVSEEELEAFDGKVIETWSYTDPEFPNMPKEVSSYEETQEWLEKAITSYDAALARTDKGGQKAPRQGAAKTTSEDEGQGKSEATNRAIGGLAARKAAMDSGRAQTSVADGQKPELDHSLDDQTPDFSKSEASQESEKKADSPASGIRARLGGLRR